ncbi:MAG: hypothetical protein ACK6CE_02430, partial [Planctomycetota bacterium]
MAARIAAETARRAARVTEWSDGWEDDGTHFDFDFDRCRLAGSHAIAGDISEAIDSDESDLWLVNKGA